MAATVSLFSDLRWTGARRISLRFRRCADQDGEASVGIGVIEFERDAGRALTRAALYFAGLPPMPFQAKSPMHVLMNENPRSRDVRPPGQLIKAQRDVICGCLSVLPFAYHAVAVFSRSPRIAVVEVLLIKGVA
jgi:hypothetical protein